MVEMEIRNAKIESTMLGYEDHGIMTAMLFLDYGGSGQGFGGYGLDGPYDQETRQRLSSNACGYFIKRVLETVGVDNWEDLKGKYIRVKSEWSKAHAIGNLLEDKWFNPAEELKTLING